MATRLEAPAQEPRNVEGQTGWVRLAGVKRSFGDVRAPLPEFMRAKAPDPPSLEPSPDVKRLLREKLDAVFLAASQPTNVRVSEPHPNLRGPGWTHGRTSP